MNKKISIVVPVYNCESLISKCLDALLKQTYNNLEIILVDDGSSDSSGDICNYYERLDARVTVIHKDNGGAADARNVGVANSNGEYIAFIDADDSVPNDYIEHLIGLIYKYDAEIACCRYVRYTTENPSFEKKDTERFFSNVDSCYALMSDCNFMVPPWGKIVASKIVKMYPFPIGRVDEDEAVIHAYLYSANGIVISDSIYYGYYQNSKGVMSKERKRHLIDLWKALNERVLFFNSKEEILQRIAFKQYTRVSMEMYYNGFLTQDYNIRQIVKKNLKNKEESITFRLFCFLFLIFGKSILSLRFKKITED